MNGVIIKQFFDEFYPKDLAYEWDNVGLQVGTLNKELTGILLSLDLTKEVVEEAINQEVNLIIVHHPLVFKPLYNILTDSYKGNLIEKLIKNDIALFVSHTNYDLGHSGMNQVLADLLKLTNQEPLEMMTDSHGIGKIGQVKAMKLDDAITYIKDHLDISHARLITKKNGKTVKTIAISGGSGASHMFEAKRKGADIYLTGDISYHHAHDMLQMGLTALDIGHYAEKHFSKALKKELTNYGVNVPIFESRVDLDPFTFV
ncbi:MAG: Nif3-like dinuclear metal center hexameric protein [Candidatus Izemoplasmataceae bacterium]